MEFEKKYEVYFRSILSLKFNFIAGEVANKLINNLLTIKNIKFLDSFKEDRVSLSDKNDPKRNKFVIKLEKSEFMFGAGPKVSFIDWKKYRDEIYNIIFKILDFKNTDKIQYIDFVYSFDINKKDIKSNIILSNIFNKQFSKLILNNKDLDTLSILSSIDKINNQQLYFRIEEDKKSIFTFTISNPVFSVKTGFDINNFYKNSYEFSEKKWEKIKEYVSKNILITKK